MAENKLKKLPIGIQTFSEIINGGYLYIDKTREIFDLIRSGKYFFMSRPRRFGKSLLCSTLKEIFSGHRKLFRGLDIYDKIDWQKHPVVSISFSRLDYRSPDELRNSIKNFTGFILFLAVIGPSHSFMSL